ncbi:MAG: phosphatase PAP2 family protein [Acidobacteria bacterium]|nr:phosphatase PAP2 family protein [Acidobacteriota bacterium]
MGIVLESGAEGRSLSRAGAAPAVAGFWAKANAVDGIYYAYFLSLGLLIFLLRDRVPAWPWFLAVHAVCLAAVTGLVRARDRQPWRFLHGWYPLLMFIVCFEETARLSFLFVDHWQDAYLLSLEARLFAVPPTVWLQQFASRWTTEILEVGYFSYFVLLMIVGGVLSRGKDQRPFRQVMTASVLSYMLCYVVFLAFPTEGPAHTLRALHTAPLEGGPFHFLVNLIQKHGGVHGNAFPSSHVAAAVVALIYAWRYVPRLGAALTPLVILLCVGAVYDRYHYVLDIVGGIVIAVPAEVLVRWMLKRERWRRLVEG